MGLKGEDEAANVDMDTVCDLLDKTLIQQLHLMEEKIKLEIAIESNIKYGSMNLAKTRYIMGHTSICTARLPVETSPEFSASTVCDVAEIDNVKQFEAVESNALNTVDPLHWFGILVPSNLHEAKKVFRNTVDVVVECVNSQMRLLQNMRNMEVLKEYKKMLTSQTF